MPPYSYSPWRPSPPLGPPRRSARQAALAMWRGVDTAPLERERAATTKSANSVMPLVLKDLRIDNRRAELEIVKVWNHLIDPTITKHAQPAGYRNGTLFVNVDSSVWLSEIVRYRRKEILTLLRHSFGADFIARISYRVG